MNECLNPDPKLRPSAKQIYDRLAATPGPVPRMRSSQQPQPSAATAAIAADAAALQSASEGRGPAKPGSGQPSGQAGAANDGATVANPLYGAAAAAEKVSEGPLMPTPLGRGRLPIKSPFELDD